MGSDESEKGDLIRGMYALKMKGTSERSIEIERENVLSEFRGQKCRDDVGSNDLDHTP